MTHHKKTIGTFFELGGRGAMESLTRTGLDYVIIDTEHGCFSEESTADLILAAESGGLLPYVRIGDIRRPYVLRMLDIGARGLIVGRIIENLALGIGKRTMSRIGQFATGAVAIAPAPDSRSATLGVSGPHAVVVQVGRAVEPENRVLPDAARRSGGWDCRLQRER